MSNVKDKALKRNFRHKRIRKKISGTSDQPRACIYRSLKNLYVQVVDDTTHKILLGLSTQTKELKNTIKSGSNVAAATLLGEQFAAEAQKKGIKKICFDRGGYLYHGRVKAFAEAARKGGMEF